MTDGGRRMNVLALDTATEILSLSAARGDAWAALSVQRGLQHSPVLLPAAGRLLGDLEMTVQDLELIVCSIGPGSFTGIRIGLATALGIGHGLGIPVVGVSTLDAMAYSWAAHGGDVFPVIDARRGNIYTARYRGGSRRSEYRDVSPSSSPSFWPQPSLLSSSARIRRASSSSSATISEKRPSRIPLIRAPCSDGEWRRSPRRVRIRRNCGPSIFGRAKPRE